MVAPDGQVDKHLSARGLCDGHGALTFTCQVATSGDAVVLSNSSSS